MNINQIKELESLLYIKEKDDVENILETISNPEILYVYAYNYNWDNGFEIPRMILKNKNCELSTALLMFYRCYGYSFMMRENNNNQSEWFLFTRELYESIVSQKYELGTIGFKVPLSKTQLFKIKKMLSKDDEIIVKSIPGVCLDIDV